MRFRFSQVVGLAATCLVALVLFFTDESNLTWRDNWWDTLHQIAPRDRGDPDKAPAVVIAIDEVTMQETQRWPWPRDLLAKLVNDLAKHGTHVVAFDLFLDDTDSQSPHAVARRFRDRGQIGAAELLEGLDDTDLILARAINDQSRLSNVKTIFPVPGVKSFAGVNPQLECRFEKPIVLLDPPEIIANFGKGFVSADPPLLLYREAGVELAAIDFDPGHDFVVRKVKAVLPICDAPFTLMGPEALRLASDGFFTKIQKTWSGLEVFLDDPSNPDAIRFPIERDGTFWLHYGQLGAEAAHGRGRELRRYISAREVMSPGFDRSRLQGKIAFVAVIDLGRIDQRRTPLGPIIYGVEAHLQMIEQIVNGQFLRRPWFLAMVEIAVFILASLFVSFRTPFSHPLRMGSIIFGVTGGMLGASLVAFKAGLLIDAATPALGFVVASAGTVLSNWVERDRGRLLSDLALTREQLDRQFLQGELDAAARMQTALLPPTLFDANHRVDLACYLVPARTVGGDFYDYVLKDDRYLVLVAADVAGKGADASQFMLICKTLFRSLVERADLPVAEMLRKLNDEVQAQNRAMMFLTICLGILDLETGKMTYTTGGHDSPIHKKPSVEAYYLPRRGGPPLGIVQNASFEFGEFKLSPGDHVVFCTDGVTEALDQNEELYSADRLVACINKVTRGASSEELLATIRQDLERFTVNSEISDDITILVVSLHPERTKDEVVEVS